MVFKERRKYNSKRLPTDFLVRSLIKMIQGTYDMVDKVWILRTLFQGKMVVDLVHSRDTNYLRIRLISFDQVNL